MMGEARSREEAGTCSADAASEAAAARAEVGPVGGAEAEVPAGEDPDADAPPPPLPRDPLRLPPAAPPVPLPPPPPPPKRRSRPHAPPLVPRRHASDAEKLATNQSLLEASARMDDVVSELVSAVRILADPASDGGRATDRREEALRTVRTSLVPFLCVASRTLRDAGMSYAPFGGTLSLHRRNEARRKRELGTALGSSREGRGRRRFASRGAAGAGAESAGASNSGGDAGEDEGRGRTDGDERADAKADVDRRSPALRMIDDFVDRSLAEIPEDLANLQRDAEAAAAEAEAGAKAEAEAAASEVRAAEVKAEADVDALCAHFHGDPDALRSRLRVVPAEASEAEAPRKRGGGGGGAPKGGGTTGSRGTSAKATELAAYKADSRFETILVPRPLDGDRYTRSEALRACKLYPKGSWGRGAVVRAAIRRGWIPASTKTVTRLCQADEEGHPVVGEEWRTGRPRTMPPPGMLRPSPPLPRVKREELVEVTMPRGAQGGGGRRKLKRPADVDGDEGARFTKKVKIEGSSSEKADRGSPTGKKKKEKKETSKDGPRTKVEEGKEEPRGVLTWAERERRTEASPLVRDFPLPPPQNGSVYRKSEAVLIARQYPKGSRKRKHCILAMKRRGFVPNSAKSMYRLLRKDELGQEIVDDDWIQAGCPALLTNEEVDDVVERIRAGDAKVFGRDGVEATLVAAVRAKVVRQGRDPDEVPIKFSRSSVRNYEAMFRSKLGSGHWGE